MYITPGLLRLGVFHMRKNIYIVLQIGHIKLEDMMSELSGTTLWNPDIDCIAPLFHLQHLSHFHSLIVHF